MTVTSRAVRTFRLSLGFSAILLLGGCSMLPHDPAEVAIINPQQAQLSAVIHLAGSGWPASNWWTKYNDPQLNMLISQALQNSPRVQAAQLQIAQSEANVDVARSLSGVQATAVAAQNRLRTSHRSYLALLFFPA